MNDLIGKEDALKVLNMFLHKQCDLERTAFAYDQSTVWGAVKMATDALAGIGKQTAEPEWIPCSERLPENPDEVLTTYIVNGNRKKRFVETATYYDGDEGFWSSPWDEYKVPGTRIEVIAWMPLPKPYREEDHESNKA